VNLHERNAEILERMQHLERLEPQLREVFTQGKREQLLAGTDASGHPFAPLAQSTLRQRQGSGPPLAPRGADSLIVTGYQITVAVASGQLTITAGWPFLSWVKYHRTGTRRMPRRDPGGFRPADVADAMRRLREYLFDVR
jgi:hypothetical protein